MEEFSSAIASLAAGSDGGGVAAAAAAAKSWSRGGGPASAGGASAAAGSGMRLGNTRGSASRVAAWTGAGAGIAIAAVPVLPSWVRQRKFRPSRTMRMHWGSALNQRNHLWQSWSPATHQRPEIDGGTEIPGEIAGFAREAAFLGVADRQLGAGGRVDLHRGAGDELADLRSGQPGRRLRPGRGCRGKYQRPRKDQLEHSCPPIMLS